MLYIVFIFFGLATTFCCHALTVLPGLSFTQATNAPLAGVLNVTTDTDSRISVSVDDGKKTWKRDFFDFGTNHSETLLGFKANRTNVLTVTVHDQFQKSFTAADSLVFITAPLPTNMPTIRLRTNIVEKMEPGDTLFRVVNLTLGRGYVTIVDNSGEVVWYSELPAAFDVRQLTNGDLFFPLNNGTAFAEVNMLGQTVKTWHADLYIDAHEDFMTEHGTVFYLNKFQKPNTRFPSSVTDPRAPLITTNVSCYRIVEKSVDNTATYALWSLDSILDPSRVDYLTYLIPEEGADPEHANAVIEDPVDHSIIVSLRNQDAIVKFLRSGQIKWILGPHDNWGDQWQHYLLKPVGTPFAWNYGQHAPMLTPKHTLLLFDNGNCRAEPGAPPVPDEANFSRAAEFQIDESTMRVSQVWQFADTNTDRLYSGSVGSSFWLPQTSNVLVTFGCISYENGTHPNPIATNASTVRIKEVTHEVNPTVVFDLELSNPDNTPSNSKGYRVYRSYRIPNL